MGLLLSLFAYKMEQHRPPKRAGKNALFHRQTTTGGTALQREGYRRLQQNRVRHYVIHQPNFPRLARPQRLAGEDHLQCRADANQTRQTLGSSRTREQPQLNLGQAQYRFRIIGTDAPMAGQGQLQTATEAGSVDGGNHRNSERVNIRHDFPSLIRQRLRLLGRGATVDHVDIGPGNKVVRLGGDKHHAAQILVVTDRFNDGANLATKLCLEGIHLLARHVDSDHGDIVRPHVQGKCGGGCHFSFHFHYSASRTMAAPSPPAAQAVTNPKPPPRRRSSCSVWVIIRAPVAAKGCP